MGKKAAPAAIGAVVGGPVGAVVGGAIGAAKPKKITPPGMDPATAALLEKQRQILDTLDRSLANEADVTDQERGILRTVSGLTNEDGSLNQNRIRGLRDRLAQFDQAQQTIGQEGLNALSGFFEPSELQTISQDIGQIEANRLKSALQGDIPISEGQKQREAERFELLKESAGQRGIRLEGDDVFTATSQSTAGNQLLSRLRQEATTQRDNFRQSEIQNRTQANLSRLGLGLQGQNQLFNQAAGVANLADPGRIPLQMFNASNQASQLPIIGAGLGLGQSFQQAAQPFTNQRNLQFQADIQNQANRQGFVNSIIGLGGQAIGLGLGGGFGGAKRGAPAPTGG